MADLAEQVLRRSRCAAQWLGPRRTHADPGAVVAHLVGVQAQLPSAAALAVRARSTGPTAADVAGVVSSGHIVRTWLLRGTIHLVAGPDVDWLLAVLRPAVLRALRRRHGQLGLDQCTLDRSVDVLADALAGGPATRTELFARLSGTGIDPSGQRGIHLVQHAALHGALCFGPDRGVQPTWVRRTVGADRFGGARDEALAELARRFRLGHGPSTAEDLAHWSGLSLADARVAWAAAGPIPVPEAPADGVTVRLLGHFDPYLMGYRSRDLAVPPAHARQVWTGGGFVLPTLLVDGRVVGTWRGQVRRGRLAVDLAPFARLDDAVREQVEQDLADVGRFVGQDVSLG